jgi:hypothetical protein
MAGKAAARRSGGRRAGGGVHGADGATTRRSLILFPSATANLGCQCFGISPEISCGWVVVKFAGKTTGALRLLSQRQRVSIFGHSRQRRRADIRSSEPGHFRRACVRCPAASQTDAREFFRRALIYEALFGRLRVNHEAYRTRA